MQGVELAGAGLLLKPLLLGGKSSSTMGTRLIDKDWIECPEIIDGLEL